MKGFQVAPAEVEAVLHGHPAVRRLRGVRHRRRAGRRGAGGRRAARPGPARRRRPSSSSSWPTRSPPTSSCATSWSSTPIPRLPVGQGAAPHAPRRVGAAAHRTERLMDVRLSPEQRALRDSAVQLVGRLGPTTVGRARRRRARAPSSTPPSTPPAGASCARADDDGAPWASAVEVAHRGRGARPRRSPTPPSSARPWPPTSGAAPARPPPPRPRRSLLTADLGDLARVDGAIRGDRWPSTPPAPRRRWCSSRTGGHRLGTVDLAPAEVRADLTRPTSPHHGAADRAAPSPLDAGRPLTDDDLTRVDRARPRRHLRRPRRRDARRRRPRRRLRRRAPAVRRGRSARSRPCSTCSPTPSSRRRAPAAPPSTRRGPSTPSRPTRRWPPAPSPRPGAPAPPGPCARRPSRCTAASATPGSASPTSTCGARCSSIDVLGGVGRQPRAGARRTTASEAAMDFGDSPGRGRVPRAAARLAGGRTTPACRASSTVRRLLARPGRLAPRRSTTPGSSGCRGPRTSAATSCPPSTTSSSTTSWPPPARRPAPASATSCRGSSSTAATTSSSGSCPGSSTGASAGARASASPTPAPTSPRSAPAPSATATST